MNEADVLKTIVGKMFSKSDDEVTALLMDGEALKADAADQILSLNEAKIAKLKADKDDNFNKGYKKAEKEVKTAVEKRFKELTQFDSDAEDFETLVMSYKEFIETAGAKKKLTDDDVKKHPLFIQLEQSRVPKEEHEKVINEFETFKKQAAKSSILTQIKSKAWDAVTKKNPILPKVPAIATTLQTKFLQEFDQYDFEEQDGNLVTIKDGKRVDDQHGNLKNFDSIVLDIAGNFFEFQVQGSKGAPGHENGGGGTVNVQPKTGAELNKVFAEHPSNSEDDRKIRVAAAKFYEANKTD